MSEGYEPKPYNGIQTYSLSKSSGATNWTLHNYSAVKQGNTAFIRLTVSCQAGQDTSEVTLVALPNELKPYIEQLYRENCNANGYGTDCNVRITTSGEFTVQLPEASSGHISFRINVVYPTAN